MRSETGSTGKAAGRTPVPEIDAELQRWLDDGGDASGQLAGGPARGTDEPAARHPAR